MEILEQKLNDNEKNYIIVKYNNYTRNIKLQDINGKFNIKDAVNNAYNIGTEYNILMAGSLLSMIPIVVIYALAQKYFKEGLMAGGVKG